MDHAFARVGGQHYDKKSADLANQRTADFFKKNLK
ncbi:MAG TPA: dienelactone hydrolase family protein [Stellaceae bacterium]|nr:dienelactone hydrolase family protein [Stellaceae bacterium]